ncbi:hypothetical protein pdam_00019685 [Pocillopora damicornis]|uniref:Uncharacterized protein n=1 Tax=Pocillopora damicornis TaxID=46731 RepID=A0A3M6UMR9_POCDA|nr:hypothetical protein pdam_00019685 [Pocillopora damicornis]
MEESERLSHSLSGSEKRVSEGGGRRLLWIQVSTTSHQLPVLLFETSIGMVKQNIKAEEVY